MNMQAGSRGAHIAALALLGAALLLGGCAPAPDMAPVQAERSKPVQRFDSFQSAASNGRWIAAGAAGGVIVASSDAGARWTRHVLPQPSSIVAMTACPDGSFAALDFYRKVWVADAEAATWTARPLPSKSDMLALSCDPANRLWVAGAHTTLMVSADRGASWQSQDMGEDAILTTLQFIDARHAVATGEFGTVLRSADAGASWQKAEPMPGEFYPYAALFTDGQTGWVSGLAGVILGTRDGGKTWAPQDTPSGVPLYALLKLGDQVYGVGAGGRMVTQRGGQWQRFDPGADAISQPVAGAALDARSLFVAGAGGALAVIKLPEQLTLAASLPRHAD